MLRFNFGFGPCGIAFTAGVVWNVTQPDHYAGWFNNSNINYGPLTVGFATGAGGALLPEYDNTPGDDAASLFAGGIFPPAIGITASFTYYFELPVVSDLLNNGLGNVANAVAPAAFALFAIPGALNQAAAAMGAAGQFFSKVFNTLCS